MSKFDITVIINAHREGPMVLASLESVEHAVSFAQSKKLSVEVIAVLDRPDSVTRQILLAWAGKRSSTRVIDVDFGDLGLSRNYGVAVSLGVWIAFLDGDDLWCEEWLVSAVSMGESEDRLIVMHPEVNLYFGERSYIFLHIDMDDDRYNEGLIAESNLWTALCVAPRWLLEEVSYSQINLEHQIGYEDWSWNIATIAYGAVHKFVPGTVHAIRTKAVSLAKTSSYVEALCQPTDFFRSKLLIDR